MFCAEANLPALDSRRSRALFGRLSAKTTFPSHVASIRGRTLADPAPSRTEARHGDESARSTDSWSHEETSRPSPVFRISRRGIPPPHRSAFAVSHDYDDLTFLEPSDVFQPVTLMGFGYRPGTSLESHRDP
jgi:hypothetical protein